MEQFQVEEISIEVPWGHISAKAWGDKNDTHVLTFHGVLDNAGSFDRLIPKLPKSFYYICFDLPGHGKSSHFPPFLPIHSSDYVISYKLIADHFGKKQYIILGHSYGGMIGTLFARLYPHYVEKIILLDTVQFWPVSSKYFGTYLREKFDSILDLNEKMSNNSQPSYTYDEALYKISFFRQYGEVNEEAAKCLLERAITPAKDDKYYFTADQRLKCFINPLYDFRYGVETLKKTPLTCPVLMLLGLDSHLQLVYMQPYIKHFKNNYKHFFIKEIPGNHDVHMNNPDVVAKYVNKFLMQKKSRL